MAQIEFIIEITATGLCAYSKDFESLPVGTSGDNIEMLKLNILEATNLWLEHNGLDIITINQIVLINDPNAFT